MPRKPPPQKPGKSETIVRTPPEFLTAVKRFLGIKKFAIDLAASLDNAVAKLLFTKEDDSLSRHWYEVIDTGQWGWLNPPYDNIGPWAKKCWEESRGGVHVAFLVPYAPGTKWWRNYVHDKARVYCVWGRLKFLDKDGNPITDKKGRPASYPKDLALVLYGDEPGFDYFDWKDEL